MTAIDIDEIRKRAEAATDGPWRTGWPKGLRRWEVYIATDVPAVELSHSKQGIADAEFIAHARTDVPALIAEVERLRAELDRRQAVVDAARKAVNTDAVDEWNALVDAVERYDAGAGA